MKLKDIINLPSYARRNMRIYLGSRPYHRETRKSLSRDEMIDYLRRNNVRSIGQLESVRKKGDPKVQDFRKEFGQWSAALRAAFGPPLMKAEVSVNYLLKCLLQFDIRTWKDYLAARKKDPDIFPSSYAIKKEFRTFKDFRACAYGWSIRDTTYECLKLRRRFDRNPTMEECRNAGLIMDNIIEFFGGLAKWNKYLTDIAQLSERGKGTS